MALVRVDAIILQAFAYSETSKILRLLTGTHGVRSVIAKGALRPKSRYGGILEPFTEGVATFYLKENRDLHTLSAFELGRSHQALGRDLVRFGAASLLSELILRAGSEAVEPSLFARLRAALRRLAAAPAAETEAIALAEAWALVAQLGFAPALDACLGCGRELDSDEDATFDYAGGGIRCAGCGAAGGGKRLPPSARAALADLVRGDAPRLPRTEGHWRLLDLFLAHHVLEGREMRSLAFLSTTLEKG